MKVPVRATTGKLETPTWEKFGQRVSPRGIRLNIQRKVLNTKRQKSPRATQLEITNSPQSDTQSVNQPVIRVDSWGFELSEATVDIKLVHNLRARLYCGAPHGYISLSST